MRRRWLAALALVAGLLAAGCRVQADVAVTVEEEGTGQVAVTVTVDEQAAERIPDLAAQLEAADLESNGWTVVAPEATPDGGVVVAATKRFGSPEQLAAVLDEVSGEDGPFSDLALERSHAWAETEWTFTGEVDATGGVVAFSDEELAALLGGEPLGYDLDALAEELGQPVDELVDWSLTADFTEADTIEVAPPGQPGSETRDAGASARWSGTFADEQPTAVSATASRVDTTTRLLAGVAALALLLLVLLVLFRLIRARRRRTRERRARAEAAAASVGQPARAGVEGTSVRPVPDEPTTPVPVVSEPSPVPVPPPPPPPPDPVADAGDDDLYEDDPEHRAHPDGEEPAEPSPPDDADDGADEDAEDR